MRSWYCFIYATANLILIDYEAMSFGNNLVSTRCFTGYTLIKNCIFLDKIHGINMKNYSQLVKRPEDFLKQMG